MPDIYKSTPAAIDGIIAVSGDDAIKTAKELAQKHGIFCGISAGANLFAAKQLAEKYPEKLEMFRNKKQGVADIRRSRWSSRSGLALLITHHS